MTPDPATRAREILGADTARVLLPAEFETLVQRIAAALAERDADLTPPRLATYDALCRFFADASVDMSESGEVDTYDLWESAEKAGLARQVPYDENKHRHLDCDAVDLVWELTEGGNRAVGRANDLDRQRAAPAPQEREGETS